MDPTQIDFAKILADFLKDSTGEIFRKTADLTQQQLKKLGIALQIGFEPYLKATLDRAGSVKTLLYRDRRVPIDEIYVAPSFLHAGVTLEEDQLLHSLFSGGKLLVSGGAGSGKSIFIKRVVSVCIKRKPRIIPIFAELRHMNRSHSSIMHYVLTDVLSLHMPNFTKEEMHLAFQSGSFILVLDGFDEINHEKRKYALEEMTYICRKYPNLPLLVSSRPNDNVSGLADLDQYNVLPMKKRGAVELIDRLDFDDETKESFIQSLGREIFNSHEDFASNPLLLTMLMLTYDQIGDIPSRMHIFYNQAYETLAFKHDRLKSLYVRKTWSDLNVEDVRHVYSFFCAISYFQEVYSFSETECVELIARALGYFDIDADPDLLKNDLIESYCMLQRDGLYVTFVHRSFQEYFAAYFLSRTEDMEILSSLASLSERGERESCLFLLYDMAPERVERQWLFAFLDECLYTLNLLAEYRDVASFVRRCFEGISISESDGVVSGPPTPFMLATRLAIKLIQGRLEKFTPNRSDTTIQSDPAKSMQSIKDFFGGRITQFEGKFFQPSDEDNAWLRGTEIEIELSHFTAVRSAFFKYKEQREASKGGLHGKLLASERRKNLNLSTEDFMARTEIVDGKGKRKRGERVIQRGVYLKE